MTPETGDERVRLAQALTDLKAKGASDDATWAFMTLALAELVKAKGSPQASVFSGAAQAMVGRLGPDEQRMVAEALFQKPAAGAPMSDIIRLWRFRADIIRRFCGGYTTRRLPRPLCAGLSPIGRCTRRGDR